MSVRQVQPQHVLLHQLKHLGVQSLDKHFGARVTELASEFQLTILRPLHFGGVLLLYLLYLACGHAHWAGGPDEVFKRSFRSRLAVLGL